MMGPYLYWMFVRIAYYVLRGAWYVRHHSLIRSFADSLSYPVALHHLDLLRRQLVQLIHQQINLPIRHLDPPLERGLLVRHPLRGQPAVSEDLHLVCYEYICT